MDQSDRFVTLSYLGYFNEKKSPVKGCETKFMDLFRHRGICNKKLGKVKNFQFYVAIGFFEKRAKTSSRRAYSAPPPKKK